VSTGRGRFGQPLRSADASRTILQGFANPTLQSLSQDAAAVSAEFEGLVDGLDEIRLQWSSGAGTWTIAQCLEHLTVTAERARPSFDAALRRARGGGRDDRSLRPSPIGRWLLDKAGPGGTRRLTAPKRLAPPAAPEVGALERFLASQLHLLWVIEAAYGRDINRIVVAAPISRILPVSLGEVLAVTIAHSRRHLEQARRVRRDPRFPA
jgi:hypothetical protein